MHFKMGADVPQRMFRTRYVLLPAVRIPCRHKERLCTVVRATPDSAYYPKAKRTRRPGEGCDTPQITRRSSGTGNVGPGCPSLRKRSARFPS
jgi:hypothetical protein